jgi:hypothetical protein
MRLRLMLPFMLGLAGCSDSAATFVGTWTCATTVTVSDRFGVNSSTDNGTWTVTELGSGEIGVHEDIIKDCAPIKLKVSGSTASVEPGQSCISSDGTDTTYVSLQAMADGNTLTMTEHSTWQDGIDDRVANCHR